MPPLLAPALTLLVLLSLVAFAFSRLTPRRSLRATKLSNETIEASVDHIVGSIRARDEHAPVTASMVRNAMGQRVLVTGLGTAERTIVSFDAPNPHEDRSVERYYSYSVILRPDGTVVDIQRFAVGVRWIEGNLSYDTLPPNDPTNWGSAGWFRTIEARARADERLFSWVLSPLVIAMCLTPVALIVLVATGHLKNEPGTLLFGGGICLSVAWVVAQYVRLRRMRTPS